MTAAGRRWIVLLAALAATLLTARLGVWQLDRAAQKNALQATLDARMALPALLPAELAHEVQAAATQHHRAVRLEGQWLAERTVYLENRQMNGRPGFFAVTPLRLDDGSAVLVQRGWLPRDPMDRTRIVAAPPAPGRVAILGRIAPAPGRLYEFEAGASGPIRQNLDLDAYARETGLLLRPLTVVQEDGQPPPDDGLLRQWPRPAAGVHKHYGYAFQWFALSALILGLYVWFQLIRPRRARQRSRG
ncbi:MAG: SURF1 family protein [Betaproteobacteria bacterium]|nr:SURF1 family protein [Betaproteobacteria bacterium]